MTASGIEPATFRLVTQRYNKPCHRVPPPSDIKWHKLSGLRGLRDLQRWCWRLKTYWVVVPTVKTAKQLPAFRRNVVPSKRRCLPVETVWRHWALQIFCAGSVSVSPQCHAQRYVNWHSLDLTVGKASSRTPYNFLPFMLRFFCISNTNYT